MESFILSIVIFVVLIGILTLMSNILCTAKTAKKRKDHANWLKYGLISKKDLYNLDPYEFGKWSAWLLEKLGYRNVFVTEETTYTGKDIICEKDGEIVYIVCKKLGFPGVSENHSMITINMVQGLVGAMVHDRISHGMIITTGIATQEAMRYIEGLPSVYEITIIDGNKLIKLHRDLRERSIYVNNRDPRVDTV